MSEKESIFEQQPPTIGINASAGIGNNGSPDRFANLRARIKRIPFAGKHPKLALFVIAFLSLASLVAVSIHRFSLDQNDIIASYTFWLIVLLLFLLFATVVLVVPNLAAIWLVWRTTPFSGRNRINTVPLVIPKESITKCLQGIFESEHFLSTLRTSLPKGNDDQLHGFDYIPFLLHSIDERRKRFSKSSGRFLSAIVILGIVFSGVVMYFGYILVNEAAAGTPRKMAEIEGHERGIASSLAGLVSIQPYSSLEFQKNCLPKLYALRKAKPKDAKYDSEKESIDSKISSLNYSKDLIGLYNSITGTHIAPADQTKESEYVSALSTATESISEYIKKQEDFSKEVNANLASVNAVIVDADKRYQDPQNHLPEIIKRLALGIVVATFFLAILRYLGGIYQNHYQEMLLAEHEDLAVRRFYVGFKSSAASDDQRKAVLTAFIAGLPPTPLAKSGDEASGTGSKLESEILKELFSALSKKL